MCTPGIGECTTIGFLSICGYLDINATKIQKNKRPLELERIMDSETFVANETRDILYFVHLLSHFLIQTVLNW